MSTARERVDAYHSGDLERTLNAYSERPAFGYPSQYISDLRELAGINTNKLDQLVHRCKFSVEVEVNPHRDVRMTTFAFIQEQRGFRLFKDENVKQEVLATMLSGNDLVKIQFYPDTPIGFYVVWHHDVDAALDEALAILDGIGKKETT